jgi:hypothetical protein
MSSFSDQQHLLSFLFPNMDVNIRPLMNQSTSVHVRVMPILSYIFKLDEKEQMLQAKVALLLSWVFETLTWNATEFGGTQNIKITPKSVWIPDLIYRNSVENAFELDTSDNLKLTIQADGKASWITGANLKLHVQLT